jgi:acyl carrier protein
MSIDALRQVLLELGVDDGELSSGSHLRADLALDSTQTKDLEIELEARFHTRVDLWAARDYTLEELSRAIDGGATG